MNRMILAFLVCFLLISCDFFEKKGVEEEPAYTAVIAWDLGLYSNYNQSTTLDGDFIYFYERPPEYNTANIYTLTKLSAGTGELIWRTLLFHDIVICQPVIIEGYIYVFLEPNFIVCFNKETGDYIAAVELNIQNKNLRMEFNATAYQQYIYLSLHNGVDRYFVRLDVNVIDYNNETEIIQLITPEILWIPETGGFITAKPVVYNNAVYISTNSLLAQEPVELAGFEINTKQMVFYKTFGGPEDFADNVSFPEKGAYLGSNPILINDDVLYHLSWSISAWDIKTGEMLYRHVFTDEIPNEKKYYASDLLQAVFYNEKIFYVSLESYNKEGYRNIHCVDATTGKLVWNDIAKYSYSLNINPVIAHERLYISQNTGLRVYEPETGRLIGVDRSFIGPGQDRLILYGDYMIGTRMNPENGDCWLVAVYVGK